MRRFVLGWKMLGLERSLGSRIVTYADDLVILCQKGKAEEAVQRLACNRDSMREVQMARRNGKERPWRLCMPSLFRGDMNITHGLRQALQINPQGVAILENDHKLSWAELGDRVSRFAAALREIGAPGPPINNGMAAPLPTT